MVTSCHHFDLLDRSGNGPTAAWHLNAGVTGGTPAFDGTTAYFIARDHSVLAIDAATGHERWRTSIGTVGDAPITSSCVAASSLVICGDSGLVALRSIDGSPAWRYDVAREQPGHFPLALHAGVVYAGSFGRGTVYAVDASIGAARWVSPVLASEPTGVNIPQLSVDDDIVVGAFIKGTKPQTGGVVALDAKTGAVRWITNFPQGAPDSTSGAISTALWESSVLASSQDGKIYTLDRATGAIEAQFPGVGRSPNISGITPVIGEDFRQIAVQGNTLYAGSFGAWFIAYDLPSHKELWRAADPDGSMNASAIVPDGDVVYVVHVNGHLAAMSATRPHVAWDFGNFENAFAASVAVSPDRVFVSGVTGFWARSCAEICVESETMVR